jgi:NADH-quinone oxidoreductase subunit N
MNAELGKMLLAILPEMGLLILAAIILGLDLRWRARRDHKLGWITAGGVLIIIVLSVLFSQPGKEPRLIWGGMLRLDQSGFVFRLIFLAGAAITSLFATDNEACCKRGEFFALLLISALGMSLMASSADLVMLYLAIETTALPLFVMAGFLTHDEKSTEAGIKYFLFGAMTSAVMLFGFSLLYGFTGSTQIYQLGNLLTAGNLPMVSIAAAVLLVLVGFGFKVSAVPFHFWAPDVYEGAPTPVAGYLSTASKAAGFAVLLRVLVAVFPSVSNTWVLIVAVLAIVSMFIGNLLAMAQSNIKRLLAYSSIAQAGYILIGVAANSTLGTSAAVYYLMAYLVTNMAAFGIVTIIGKSTESNELSAYAGLSRRSPALALVLLIALLSLAGIPPFAGFFGKLIVFASAVEGGLWWLALIGLVNSMIALYYYLTILKVVYLNRSPQEEKAVSVSVAWKVALGICVFGVLILGTVFIPWYTAASQAAQALF